ncbi:hypothetical protein [Rubritalea marina]|uniref:hypothetical protein n=1 Tax=Rubritalea marina TaxID=361055 RepID=UPI000367E7B0|nr:hypothetical protein [Rubritalea marina]
MRDTLTIIGLFLLAYAFRSCQPVRLRRLGTLLYVVATITMILLITDSYFIAALGALAWLAFPLLPIALQTKNLRLPIRNKLTEEDLPSMKHFPGAELAIRQLEAYEFEPCSKLHWEGAPSNQHLLVFWNPHLRLSATITLCIHRHVTYSYFSLISRTNDGQTFRTTNFHRPTTLMLPPEQHLSQLKSPCCGIRDALDRHRKSLQDHQITICELRIPCPESINKELIQDKDNVIEHNLKQGIITAVDHQHSKYSWRGQLFLWRQSLKDLLRIC